MIEGALQDAVDSVWTNTIGRVVSWLPDWLVWLFSYSADVWVLWAISFAIGYVFGRWGFVALISIAGALFAVFTLGRRSKETPLPPIPRPRPKPKNIFEQIFKRGQ